MRHKRLVFSRIQHFSISAAGMSRSQKGSSSLETELLPERYPRLRIVASCSKELHHARRAAHFVAPGTDMVYNLPLATN